MEDLKKEIENLNAKVESLEKRVNDLETQEIPTFIGTEDIMKILGISHNTVTKLLKEIPVIKIGNKYRISKKEFNKWIESKQQKNI